MNSCNQVRSNVYKWIKKKKDIDYSDLAWRFIYIWNSYTSPDPGSGLRSSASREEFLGTESNLKPGWLTNLPIKSLRGDKFPPSTDGGNGIYLSVRTYYRNISRMDIGMHFSSWIRSPRVLVWLRKRCTARCMDDSAMFLLSFKDRRDDSKSLSIDH